MWDVIWLAAAAFGGALFATLMIYVGWCMCETAHHFGREDHFLDD